MAPHKQSSANPFFVTRPLHTSANERTNETTMQHASHAHKPRNQHAHKRNGNVLFIETQFLIVFVIIIINRA